VPASLGGSRPYCSGGWWLRAHLCARMCLCAWGRSSSARDTDSQARAQTCWWAGAQTKKKGTHSQNDLSIDHCDLKLARPTQHLKHIVSGEDMRAKQNDVFY